MLCSKYHTFPLKLTSTHVFFCEDIACQGKKMGVENARKQNFNQTLGRCVTCDLHNIPKIYHLRLHKKDQQIGSP